MALKDNKKSKKTTITVKVGDIIYASTGVPVKVLEYSPRFGGRVLVERADGIVPMIGDKKARPLWRPLSGFTLKKKLNNGGGVGVSSVIDKNDNTIGTGADLNTDQYGGGGRVKSADENSATGSPQLKEEAQAKIDKGETVIHFAYTNYGGSFMDKVAIAYFKKHYPKNTLSEKTSYDGENAFIFGKPANEWIKESAKYPLGYEDIEGLYLEMESEQERKDYKLFLNDLKGKYKISPKTLDWLLENRGGYYQMNPDGLDFSYEDLTADLISEKLISMKKMDNGGGVGTGVEDASEIGIGTTAEFNSYAKGGGIEELGEVNGYTGGYDVTIYETEEGNGEVQEGGLSYDNAVKIAKQILNNDDVYEVAVIVTDQNNLPSGEGTIRWISRKKFAKGGGVGKKPKMVRSVFEEEEMEYAKGSTVNGLSVGDDVYVIELEQPNENWYGTIIKVGEKFSEVENGDEEIITVRNNEIMKEGEYKKGGGVGQSNWEYSIGGL